MLRDVTFKYGGNLVLKNISLDYKLDDFLSISGPNGGGKSTLLKIILGLLSPTSGEVKIFGKNPKDIWHKLGYVPQNISISSQFPITALEVVLMGNIDRKIFGFYDKRDKISAMSSLELVDMKEFSNKRIDELSGGQRQRVYIARALQSKSEILLLDEPTASIDTAGQIQIYTLLKKLNSNGTGIIVISHDINLTLNYATKAAYVANGKLVMHDINDTTPRDKFLQHLKSDHSHFCDIELALMECPCVK